MILRILSIILIITIPVVALCLGLNAATRLPDVYQYELKATDILEEMDIELSNDEMGEFISHFMMGEEPQFQLWTGDEEKPEAVFTQEELSAANQLRHDLNITAIVGFVLMILMVASFVILKKKECNQELRKYYCRALLIYIILLIILTIINIVLGDYSVWHLTSYALKEDTTDILPQLITDGLVKNISLAAVAISTLFMGAIGYATYKITEPKRIFSRN